MKYKLSDLENLGTLSSSQSCDLKIDTGTTRVWLSRCGVEDGEPYPNKITIEHYDRIDRLWVIKETYQGVE